MNTGPDEDEKVLGINPESGQEVLLRKGTMYPFIQTGRVSDGYGGEPRKLAVPEVCGHVVC